MKLGEKLRQLRERRQWTQPQAADAIGIEQSYLSKLENDHSVPSLEVFRRIVEAYGTDVATVMQGIDASDFAHLSQVSDIADYLQTAHQAGQARRQRRIALQRFAVALGACLIYAGIADLFFPGAAAAGEGWKNQLVTFCGIFSLTYGIVGLLIASSQPRHQR